MARKNNGIDFLNKTVIESSCIIVAWFDTKLDVSAITTIDPIVVYKKYWLFFFKIHQYTRTNERLAGFNARSDLTVFWLESIDNR
jgi:hypothetical protein